MKKHIRITALTVMSLFLLISCAFVTMIAGNAEEYCTVRINYLFENGDTAYDAYIAVFKKGTTADVTVTNPSIAGYKAVDSLESTSQPAPTTLIEGEMTQDKDMTVYYVPVEVPFSVKYYMQNVYDDDYTADLTLNESYYNKSGLTGTYPTELDSIEFEGFTRLYHKSDFIAADGSTEFELYFVRNYHLINFDLNGGHGVEPVYAKYQSPYNISEPVKKGWKFEGWVLADEDGNYINESGEQLTDEQARAAATKFTSGIVPANDVRYKAYWSADKAHYTVIYWIEDPDSTEFTDVASQVVSKYPNNTDVMSGDVIHIDDPNEVQDFFSYNLNPQKVQKDANGNIVLNEEIRPIYLTNDQGQPIDESGNVIDFPEMSPGEREELNGKQRYFEIDTERSTNNVTVSGDGTTRINIYYKRKQITQRFFFARKTSDGKYQVPGYTKAFSKHAGDLDHHLLRNYGDGGLTSWMELSNHRPEIADKYQDKLEVKTYTANNCTYYYYEMKTEYYSNLRGTWLTDAFKPMLITKNQEQGVVGDDYARFGAWSVEFGTQYSDDHEHDNNKTVKGLYEKLDEKLLYTDNYLNNKDKNGNPLTVDPLPNAEATVLNYLSFWTNAKNQDWNKKANILNFTYKYYVEILPCEYNADKTDWNGTGGYIDTIKVTYDTGTIKVYGLLQDNLIETFDGGDQYGNLATRDAKIKQQQTPAALTGFALLTDAEINNTNTLSQNPTCVWYAKDEFDADHHCDVKYFYRRRYYTLDFINNNTEEPPEKNRNIYYQMDINSTGIRDNWVYYEPQYPDVNMRPYYRFDGWYFDDAHTKKVQVIENDTSYADVNKQKHFNDSFRMPADDINLFAKWVKVKEDVSFYRDYEAYYNEDTPISECEVEYKGMILTNDVPSTNTEDNRPDLTPPSTGANFIGWYYEDETGNEIRFEPEVMPVIRRLKLYAKWNSDQSAGYKVEYVEMGTNTPVADPETGVAHVSTTKSFNAKANTELNEEHRPQTGQNNWWPTFSSHSILIKENIAGKEYEPNTFRFEYFKKDKVWYKVRYLDAATMTTLFDDREIQTADTLVSESYKPKEGYIPDRVIKTLAPAASVNSNADEAKAEELANNVIVFLYTKNNTQALVRIEHYLQNVDGGPDNRADYTHHRTERITKNINDPEDPFDMATDVYASDIATSLQASHYVINEDLTLVNDLPYTGQTITIDGNQLVVKVYYKRSKYPYKVKCVDIEDDSVIDTKIYNDPEDLKPIGSVISIVPESPITYNDTVYYPITDTPQPLTIHHEENANFDNPVHNVKTIYYKKQGKVLLQYEIVCPGMVDGELLLSHNYELVSTQEEIDGCTAIDNSGVAGRYEFLGWFKTPEANAEDRLSDQLNFIPTLPLNDTTYYAVFKMNSYTIKYIYQGRRGGNTDSSYDGYYAGNYYGDVDDSFNGSYIGDDNEYDTKTYTVILELTSTDLDANGRPSANILVNNAPAIDDLYKDCVWVIDDSHITFDEASHTLSITAKQTAKRCSVEFFYQNSTLTVQNVGINSLVKPNGNFVEAPETDGGNPFAYWSVKEKATGKEIAKGYNREFDLRVTGNITVTACYEAEAQKLFISDPDYTREQTTDAKGNKTDTLYVDFILAYMEKDGKLLNPSYQNKTTDTYKTGVIVEYDQNIMLSKADQPGAVLGDTEKVVYPDGDKLSKANAQKLANGEALSGTNHRYICYSVDNNKYNNRNRVDRALPFVNSETARHLVLRAYYYVWNQTKGTFEMTDPVYFYLYDIGNSVKKSTNS